MQKSIIDYARYAMSYRGRPLTDWLIAIPNGGKRNAREAARMKAQGVRAGAPDLVLAIAAGAYGALWIELKVGKNALSDKQAEFHNRLIEGGHWVMTCFTLQQAVDEIVLYLQDSPEFEHRGQVAA